MANKRIVTLGFLLALAWGFMFLRVFYLQVVKSEYYQAIAYGQSVSRSVLAPKRGEILDRSLQKLAVNAEVNLQPAEGSASGRSRKLTRVCPMGSLAGQVLGNVGKDGYGQLGLEYFLDRELRGTDGWKYARHDVKRRYYPGLEDRQAEPINGLNVALTIDAKLQEIVEHALERGVLRVGAKQGTVVVIDPYGGDILAMANYPFYNPNTRDASDPEAWKNMAVAKIYEPGSTFKAFTAAALLEEKKIRLDDTLDGEQGAYSMFGSTIHDTHPYGRISFRDALAFSSNICFAKASMRLKPETFYRYMRSFGFGMKTGMGLPAEESGVLPPISDWSSLTQPNIAFGHGISATPLQMAMAFGALANGGLLMQPRIVRGWVDAGGRMVRENPPRTVRRVISEATCDPLKSMLSAVVEYGTAANIRSDRITLAGKTGSAEKIENGRYMHGKLNASFVGMAPADKPEFVCLVLLDEPTQLKFGGLSAAPIFKEIVDRVMADPGYTLGRRGLPKLDEGRKGDSTAVPNLLGYGRRDALQLARGFSCPVKIEGAGDAVVAQYPRAGGRMAGSDTLLLSLGFPESRIMPDLTEGTLRDALLKLRSLGLEVEYSGAGRVIRQSPSPGARVKPGQKCALTLGWVG